MPEARLPDPDERPGADIVVYDDHCGLCGALTRLLNRLDATGRLAYSAASDERITLWCPQVSPDELGQHMIVVGRRGDCWKGAAGVRRLSRRLPALWWAVPLLHVPGSMPVWRWLYRQVARRRYLLGGHICEEDRCPTG